jgi:hypothetical protein
MERGETLDGGRPAARSMEAGRRRIAVSLHGERKKKMGN